VTADLLALLIELTSVTAAGKQIQKPITLPRPGEKASKSPGMEMRDASRSAQDHAFKKGVGVLAATTKAVSRR